MVNRRLKGNGGSAAEAARERKFGGRVRYFRGFALSDGMT
jgi:hypothetical protein